MERIRGPECTRLALVEPNARAMSLFPEEIAQKYTCVPIGMSANKVEIACLNPNNRVELSKIASQIRRPLKTRTASLPDIRQAVERVYHGRQSSFQKPAAAELLQRLGHQTVNRADSESVSRSDSPVYIATALHKLSNEQLEAVGIVSYLPHLSRNNLVPDPDLGLLISEAVARQNKIIPLWWIKDFLIAGVIPGKQTASVIQLKELPGIPIWTLACTQEAWDELYRQVYLRGSQLRMNDTERVLALLAKRGLLGESNLKVVREISRSSARPAEKICIERGLVTQEQWLSAQAQVFGITYEPPDQKRDDRREPFGDILPPRLVNALGIVPLGIEDKKLLIGMAIYERRMAGLIERISGMPVEVRLIDDTRRDAYPDLEYDIQIETTPTSCSLDELLLGMELVTPDQLSEAQTHEPGIEESFEERLVRLGYLDDNDLAESLSMLSGLPNTTLKRATFDEKVTARLPASIANKELILPLEACGGDLWVAVADPFNGEGMRSAQQASGMQIWPVIAPRKTLLAAIQQVYGIQVRDFPPELNQLLNRLVQQELLSQVEAADVKNQYSTNGMPIDQALVQSSRLEDGQVCQILSEHFHIAQTDLTIQEQTYEVIDALGQQLTRQRAVDPVDDESARLVNLETAQRLRALPIHKTEAGIQVAFAAPPTQEQLHELEGKTGQTVLPLLAPFQALEEAIERTLGKQNLGTRMLLAGALTRRQLNEALDAARRAGVRIGRALLNRGFIKQDQLYQFLSEQSGLPFQKIDPSAIQPEVVNLIPSNQARQLGVLPLSLDGERLSLAVTDPFNTSVVPEVEKLTGKEVRPVLVTEHDLEAALEAFHSREYLARSISELLERSPKDSAYRVLSRGQVISLIVIAVVSLLWIILHTTSFFVVTNIAATVFYLSFSAYKFYLVYKSMTNELEVPVTEADLDAMEDKDLPVYTILVPVYKEANVLPRLLEALEKLDYPSTKLDIKVLLEEDDQETIEAFHKIDPSTQFQPIIVPYGQPKTKPKACNYGLIHARGDYIVIFDAEDIPEPDQLKRVLAAFLKSAPEVVCIQSKLNYYNRNQNLLTRWFTVEYSMWFDLFLPGLDAAHAPIPLGGTSNHFKREALIEAGAWDPYNVTEDADLGIRMFKRGYRTAIVDSTTYEEANSHMNNWLRQRSRWIKGYIQTWLVHMRNPFKLWREIGTNAFLSFQFVIGGTFFAALANPIYWLLTTLWFLTRWDLIPKMFPGPIFFVGAVCLYIGNFAFAYMNVAGAMRRGYYDMVKYALLSPLYWGLMSIGAWRGFGQLFVKPHFWEKTVHGLTPVESKEETNDENDSNLPPEKI